MSQSTLPVTPGTGRSVAVDTIATVDYQQVKLISGEIGSTTPIEGDENGLKTQLGTSLERTLDSVTNFSAPVNCTIVDLATDEDVTVTSSPAVLLGFRVDTVMSAHAALIKDGSTTKITVAASTAANYNENTYSTSFATNITVESDNSATGKLAIFWRAA